MLGLVTDIPMALGGMQVETFIIGVFVVAFIVLWNYKIKTGFMSKIPVYSQPLNHCILKYLV